MAQAMTASRRRIGVAMLAAAVLVAAVSCGGSEGAGGSQVVTVYTGRHYGIEAVFEEFTAETGIEVRFTTGSDPELRERLIAEGANTPADLLIAADAANIDLAAAAGVLAAIESDALAGAVPDELRSADGTWFALSRRLRVIMYSTERVDTPPADYADLGDPTWKGRLCLRPSTHPYTQSLVAGLINNLGTEAATAIVESWVANDPLYVNSDTDIVKAIAAGDCDVALANSYYLARLLGEDPSLAVALQWPDQAGAGAHLNVSAAGVTASAPNREAAIRLLEWLATSGQKAFSDANNEYPADPSVEPASVLVGFGTFTADTASVRELGRLNPEAMALLSAAGYE
ncbi:MAG: extracellular solute-binding protein [Ilumatobacteraceae bacterium]